MKNFGKNLKYYRKIRGYTQDKLAEEVGVSTEFIKAIENKNKALSLEKFVKVCDVLMIPSDFLLKDESKVSEIYTIDLLLNEFDRFSNEERHFYVEVLQNIINHKSS